MVGSGMECEDGRVICLEAADGAFFGDSVKREADGQVES